MMRGERDGFEDDSLCRNENKTNEMNTSDDAMMKKKKITKMRTTTAHCMGDRETKATCSNTK